MRLEETLNGGYNGLFGEVVTQDCYKIKDLKFKPDIVFDLGANIGIFTRFVRTIFPDVTVIAVEPDSENFSHLISFSDNNEKNVFINKAIGVGKVWRELNYNNGSGAMFLSEGVGFKKEDLEERESHGGISELSKVETIMVDELIRQYVKEGDLFLVKIDIEGNEHSIFSHEPSMSALRKADYICMEVHFFSINDKGYKEVRELSINALRSFLDTHDCIFDGDNAEKRHIDFWATKKNK